MSDTETTVTRFGVAPSEADWYYCAVIDVSGETDYVDGYAAGEEPTPDALQEYARCRHAWIVGMMYVHDDDVDSVVAKRSVSCERCDRPYRDRDRAPLTIIGWRVERTSHSGVSNHLTDNA